MKFLNLHKIIEFLCVFYIIFGFSACTDSILEQDIYQPPEWQTGKLYTQIKEQSDLQYMAQILEKTSYDTIIDVSGSYTVFAPTDEAFELFFQSNPEYKALLESDEPSGLLKDLVEYQIIFNAWTRDQFTSLDVSGWVDPNNELQEPQAFKRQTILREDNKVYPAARVGDDIQIVASSNREVKAYTNSNKYVPIFFDEFFNINDLTYNDYKYYFNREFTSGELYFANAQIGDAIPAENGFIYKTDRVVLPLPNAEQLLKQGHEGHSYNIFRYYVEQFSRFSKNDEATNSQEGAEEGLAVDTLYDLTFPDLTFNIHTERTGNVFAQSHTSRDHHGLIAPTDQALNDFISDNLAAWGSYKDIPKSIAEVIVNSHMSYDAVYETDLSRGFLNGENDSVVFNGGNLSFTNVIQKEFASNCTFLGINKAIEPRVIRSVLRPLYVTNNYSTMLYALERTKVLSALKKSGASYSLFLPDDEGVLGDSSLYRVITDVALDRYYFAAYDRSLEQVVRMQNSEIRGMILNQVGISIPDGRADREFIRTLGGRYIEINNQTDIVKGTSPTTYGYRGDSILYLTPEPYAQHTDNGKFYTIETPFSFGTGSQLYGLLASKYPKFLELLRKAGLYDKTYYDFPFIVEGEFLTGFIPSDSALVEYGADTMPKNELAELLKYHFVKGEIIFTDGKKPHRNYETLSVEKDASSFMSSFSKLNIRPIPNAIEILDKNGDVYLTVNDIMGQSNNQLNFDTDPESVSMYDFITVGAIHTINKVLVKDSLNMN